MAVSSDEVIRGAARLAGVGLVGGVAALAGARVEAGAFILRRAEAPVLEPGQRPIRVLHLSDLHLTPRDRRRVAWTRGLAALDPDLVVNTGDNLAHVDAVPTVLEALDPFLGLPGAFVFGSNDYTGPKFRNPLIYFGGPSIVSSTSVALPTGDLADGLAANGWADLNNRRECLDVAGQSIRMVGMDDPHVQRDRMPAADGPRRDGELRLGVVHAPYLRALRALARDGSELVLAGHTHGGQVRLPWTALVTNCDLPRQHARGLTHWQRDPIEAPSGQEPRHPWLHVSAGLGTSPYARIRLFCRPEATLLTLVPRV